MGTQSTTAWLRMLPSWTAVSKNTTSWPCSRQQNSRQQQRQQLDARRPQQLGCCSPQDSGHLRRSCMHHRMLQLNASSSMPTSSSQQRRKAGRHRARQAGCVQLRVGAVPTHLLHEHLDEALFEVADLAPHLPSRARQGKRQRVRACLISSSGSTSANVPSSSKPQCAGCDTESPAQYGPAPTQPCTAHLLVCLSGGGDVLCGDDLAVARHQAAARGQRQVRALPDGQGEVAGAVGGGEAQPALLLQQRQGWERTSGRRSR